MVPRLVIAYLMSLGLSPAPSSASPSSSPAAVEARVESLLAKMTLEEKLDYIGGTNNFYIRAVPRLGLPAIKMADGPFGVRNNGPATTFAAGIGLAASWDPALAGRVGAMIGRDARSRGIHIMLGPSVNIYRSPLCGRNFEYMGEDPFLAARTAAAYVEGMQGQGVSATIKHFIANNSEIDRHHTSSDIDERTMREIYLPAFEAAVKDAHVGAIMNSYNLVNGVHATQNAVINNQIAKQDWGFDGVLMSDWDSTYDGVAAANAGLDLEMPSAKLMNPATLLPAIKAGQVSIATIDDKVRRILRLAARFGWLDRPQADRAWPPFSGEARTLALQTARESMVLLKNEGAVLPLDRAKLKTIAVIGPDGYPAIPVGGGSAQAKPFAPVSALQGVADAAGTAIRVTYSRGTATLAEIFDTTAFATAASGGQPGLVGEYFNGESLEGQPALTRIDEHVNFAWDRPLVWPTGTRPQSAARWQGVFIPPTTGDYRLAAFTYGLDRYRVFVDGKLVMDRQGQPQPIMFRSMALVAGRPYAVRFEYLHHDHHARVGFGIRRADQMLAPEIAELAAEADAVVVVAGFDPMTESEGYDRTFSLPEGEDALIAQVARANKRTIVALTSGGGVDMTGWLDRVPAVIETWYPGQEGGRALAEALFGDVNPSGKLPVSFERRLADGATRDSYFPDARNHVVYREGVFVGYRHFDRAAAKPLFPFGHGLSYTKFAYANLAVSAAAAPPSLGAEREPVVTVSFDVKNVGSRSGDEVAEVYVGDRHAPVPRPAKELKGFARVTLAPGEQKRVTVSLNRRAFAYYEVTNHRWAVAPGTFQVLVGPSSASIALRGTISLR